jgi:hypothetical protein
MRRTAVTWANFSRSQAEAVLATDFIDRGHAHPVESSAAAQVAGDHGGEPEPCGSAAASSCHTSLRRVMRANPPIATNALTSTVGSDQDRATDAQADDPPAAAGRRCLIGHTIDVLDERLTLLACRSPNSSVATALNWFSSARAGRTLDPARRIGMVTEVNAMDRALAMSSGQRATTERSLGMFRPRCRTSDSSAPSTASLCATIAVIDGSVRNVRSRKVRTPA